jgi:hypothetical protein
MRAEGRGTSEDQQPVAARTRNVAALCSGWKRLVALRKHAVIDMRLKVQERRSPPRYELDAYRILCRLIENSRNCPSRREVACPEWPSGLQTAEEALPATNRNGRYEAGREEILAAVRTEGERLPLELRGPYLAVILELFRNGLDRTVAFELAADRNVRDACSGAASRLVAAIIRNWG